jgi:hypothetical protein
VSSTAEGKDAGKSKKASSFIALMGNFARELREEDPDLFPSFETYIEQSCGGWGASGSCAMCGNEAERVTNDGPHCLLCIKYLYGVDTGEYLAMLRLLGSVAHIFDPVRAGVKLDSDNVTEIGEGTSVR